MDTIKERKNFSKDAGYVIVMFPFVLMAMLSALGMVVDSTNLYAARVKAGAAAEQGIISAIGARIIERSPAERQNLISSSYEQNYLRTRFATAVRNNLSINGIEASNIGPINLNSLSTALENDLENDVQFQNDIATATLRMRGSVRLRVPVFFAGVYQFFAGGQESGSNRSFVSTSVTSAATGELRGSAFVFLVDMSNSQSCPSVGQCLCNTTQRDTVGGSCRQEANMLQNNGTLPPDQRGNGSIRIEEIRAATNLILSGNRNGFVSGVVPIALDPVRDRVSVIIYNNSAQVLVPFDLGNPVAGGSVVPPGYRLDLATPLINRLVPSDLSAGVADPIIPGGNTNISDALMTAEAEIQRAGLLRPEARMRGRINVILLSEGAATAMRVQPENGALANNAPGGNDPDRLPVPPGDYINLELSMQTGPNTFIQIPSPMIRTLAYKQLVSVNNPDRPEIVPMLPASQDSTNGYPDATILPPCHIDGNTANPDLFSNDVELRAEALTACLGNSWKTMPARGAPAFGTTVPDTNRGFNSGLFDVRSSLNNDGVDGANNRLDFRNMYYLATVRAVELLSDNAIRLYTLSWGPPAANDPNRLFELASVSNVKSDLLTNLSNARDESEDFRNGIDKWANPDFAELFGGNKYGFEAKKMRALPEGGYVNAPSGAELDRLMNQLIFQAKLGVINVDKEL